MVNAVFSLLIKENVEPVAVGSARSEEEEFGVPLIQVESEDVEKLSKQLHDAVDACCNSFKKHACGYVSDGYRY